MEKIAVNEHSYQEYLKNNNWKCPNSSTGGHHWIAREEQCFVCKHCGEVKDMPIPIPENQFCLRKKNMFKRRGN